MKNFYKKIAVYGAGSWGSALACQLAKSVEKVILYSNEQNVIDDISNNNINRKYLKHIPFPKNIFPTNNILDLQDQEVIVIAIPSYAFKETINSLKNNFNLTEKVLFIASKGMTDNPPKLFSQVISTELPDIEFGFISGPNFANEVAQGFYTVTTIGSLNIETANKFAKIIESENFIVDTTTDIITLQIAGIIKNIIAIQSGINKAQGFKENAQAALITQALNEIKILSKVMGGDIETLTSPGVIGDLVLTCYSTSSRNMKFGYEFIKAKNKQLFIKNYPYLVEGQESINQIRALSKQYNLELPIINTVFNILRGK